MIRGLGRKTRFGGGVFEFRSELIFMYQAFCCSSESTFGQRTFAFVRKPPFGLAPWLLRLPNGCTLEVLGGLMRLDDLMHALLGERDLAANRRASHTARAHRDNP